MKRTRVEELDLLRLVAALAVVGYHYSFRGFAADNLSAMPYAMLAPVFKYGYLGVELFFMISGFVILMAAADGNVQKFLVSRIARLYPAFWVCCTVTFAVTLLLGDGRFPVSLSQYLVNLTMLSNYFATLPIDGAYWSLFVELKFYLLVALLLILRRIHQAQPVLILWLLATIGVEVIPYWRVHDLLITDYSAFFIGGATCYLIWSRGLSTTRVVLLIASCGLALFKTLQVLPQLSTHYDASFNHWIVATIIVSFYLMLFLIAVRRTGLFANRRWLLAGILTYPLYLLHQKIGYVIFNAFYPQVNANLLFWGVLAMMLLAAYGVHVAVERRATPLLKRKLNHAVDYLRAVLRQPILQKHLRQLGRRPLSPSKHYAPESIVAESIVGKKSIPS